MPRYHIDIGDDDLYKLDGGGAVLASDEAACRYARIALLDMANEHVPREGQCVFKVTVRDEGGAVIYEATLSLKEKQVEPKFS